MGFKEEADKMKGEAKILAGKAADNDKMQLEGRAQKLNAKANEMLERGDHRTTDKHDIPTD